MSSTSRASSSRPSIQPPVGPVNNVQAYGRPSGSGSAKRKSIVNPITTENEDLKYKAKYKELKKKVQDIELVWMVSLFKLKIKD
ncbi:hypothetical protein FRC02_006850 [Tulasnella sp. 418]|nr:hypothetical protein FRC02_006850 [Tulasnella sp. 418]